MDSANLPSTIDPDVFAYIYPRTPECAAAMKNEHNKGYYNAERERIEIRLKGDGKGQADGVDNPIRRSMTGWSFGRTTLTADVVVGDPTDTRVGHFEIALTTDFRIQFQRSTDTELGVRLLDRPLAFHDIFHFSAHRKTFYPPVKTPILIGLAPHQAQHWDRVEILLADGTTWCHIEFPNHNTQHGLWYTRKYADNLNGWLGQLVFKNRVPAADTRNLAIQQGGSGSSGSSANSNKNKSSFLYRKQLAKGPMHKTEIWIDLQTGAAGIYKFASGVDGLEGSKSWKQGQLRKQKGRLNHEIRMSKKHKHDHMMPLLYFQSGPDPCLVAPYYDAGSVDKMELEPNHAQLACWQLLEALDFLHGNNIVHRNLHPGNIFVESFRPFKIVVTGWATAAYVSPTMPPLNSGDRRLAYIAPEMLLVDKTPNKKDAREKAPYTTAVDIWSAGIIIYDWIGQISRDDVHISTLISWQPLVAKIIGNSSANFANDNIIKMAAHMVRINPSKRYTAKECLQLDRKNMVFPIRDSESRFPPGLEVGLEENNDSVLQELDAIGTLVYESEVDLVDTNRVLAAERETVRREAIMLQESTWDQMTVSDMTSGGRWTSFSVSVPSTRAMPGPGSVADSVHDSSSLGPRGPQSPDVHGQRPFYRPFYQIPTNAL